MSLVKSHRVDLKNVSFSDVKTNDNGGKSIYVNYNQKTFYMQTPVMNMPYDMSVYDKGDYPKYSLELSFRDMDEDYRVKGFHENMENFDELLVDNGVKNSMAWFKKKKTNKDVISALFNPVIKKSKDKETGEPDGRYPDNIRIKLPFRDGKPTFEIRDFDNNVITDRDPSELFVKGSKIKAILKCGGIWIVGGKFGCTWNADIIKVDAPETVKNYSFINDDTDEEDSGDSDNDNEVEDTDSE